MSSCATKFQCTQRILGGDYDSRIYFFQFHVMFDLSFREFFKKNLIALHIIA